MSCTNQAAWPVSARSKPPTARWRRNEGRYETDNNDNDACLSNVSFEDKLINISMNLSTLNPNMLGVVHWVDWEASVCVVLAKTNNGLAQLVTKMFVRWVEKS